MLKSVIRCPIHGSIQIDQVELSLLEHRFCQRLRHVSQLGFATYVYPSAGHSRLSHVLGVMHLSGRVFDHLVYAVPNPLTEYFTARQLAYHRRILRIAALLHDLGHLPFSHSIEGIFPEQYKLKALLQYLPYDLKSNVKIHHEHISHVLIKLMADEKLISQAEALDVIALLTGRLDLANVDNFNHARFNVFYLLSAIINSSLDVDRLDYLLRDSYHTGVAYGRFDLEHIIRCLSFYIDAESGFLQLALYRKGLLALEGMLLARKLMFIQVYFHKTLLKLSEMFKNALTNKEITINIWQDIESYAASSDASFLNLIFKAKHKFWCQLIYKRQLFKTLLKFEATTVKNRQRLANVSAKLDAAGILNFSAYRQIDFMSAAKNLPKYPIKIINHDPALGQSLTDLHTAFKNSPTQLSVLQLNVLAKDYAAALKVI